MRQIILNNIVKPADRRLDREIEWICNTMGLTAGRDLERISYNIMRFLITNPQSMTSQIIAEALNIETQRVLYHIRSLINAGLIDRQKRHLMIKGGRLSEAIREVKKDANYILDNLIEIAEDIERSTK